MTKKTSKKKMPGKQIDPEKRKSWQEQEKELDRKLKELLYEDRNGFRPPKPWYEEEDEQSTSAERFRDFHSKKKRYMQQASL